LDRWAFFAREWYQPHLREAFATTRRLVLAIWKSYELIPAGYVQSTISSSVTFYSGVAPERCLKISTAVLSASRCLSNVDISNSICAIVAINPSSPTGVTVRSLLGLAGNSSGAAAGSRAAPAPAAVLLRYCLDHLRNDQILTPSSLARSFADTPPVCNRWS
jgi:hypothetical protein